MGRRRAGFRKNHFFNHQQKKEENVDNRRPYSDIVKENEQFVNYYDIQEVCRKEEFDEFIKYLKTDLPATFRITGSKGVASKLQKIVEEQLIEDCVKIQDSNQKAPNIFQIPWYPKKLAWQMELTRKDIRSCEAYHKLHNFLISETEHGTISRQEAVSMIPPLLLDVKSHHKILDMCAAPGSKTAQLLEILHDDNDAAVPSGYVIANDVDNKRCYMLVHQAKRLNSPCVAVINHDSAILPNLFSTLNDGSTQQIQFDRILCDVPCSGDGTLRKNPDIWMKWTPANALNLHGIQTRILRRGIELLAVEGKIVYSTCSLNPIENEAVIHRILNEFDGCVELLDVRNVLPGLKYSPGMEQWLVTSRNLDIYKSNEDVDEKWRTTIHPKMFPPKAEDRSKYNLNRCIRILPHQQNTGAFFVAVLKKIKWTSSGDKIGNIKVTSTEDNVENMEDDSDSKKRETTEESNNPRKRKRNTGFKEDPFVFFEEGEPVWEDIKSFYNMTKDFDPKCLLTRCHVGKKKNIYLTSEAVRDLVTTNQHRIKLINTGVKAFVRCDNRNMRCPFRIANDGLESIYPFIGDERKVNIPKEDLITLLLNDNPQQSPPITTLSEMVRKQVEHLSPGSCVLVYTEESVDEDQEPLVIHISGWRGTTSMRCYTTQHSTLHLLRLLGADTSKFDKNKFQKEEEEAAKSEKEAD